MRVLVVAGVVLLLSSDVHIVYATEPQTADKIAKLIQALEDADRAVILSAMKKLGNCGTAAKQAVPALSARVRSNDKEIANQAARSLAQIGSAAVPHLVKALHDSSPAVRTRALLTLGTIGREAGDAVGPVRDFLSHPDAGVRLLAALVLGAMHEEARPAADHLEAALRDSDPRVRFVAADSLYQIGLDTVNHLVVVLKDEDDLVHVAPRIDAILAEAQA